MTTPEEIAVANRSRLKELARRTGMETRFLEQRFVLERFLHRLVRTPGWTNAVTLKGSLLLVDLCGGMKRPTEDIDAHFADTMDEEAARRFAADVASTPPAEEDGLVFDSSQLRVRTIIEGHIPGLRLSFPAAWANAASKADVLSVKLDLAWGDSPLAPTVRDLPSVLPKVFPPVSIASYPWEQVLAEKIHALARHGADTTRMKDFLDLKLIAGSAELDAGLAVDALRETFKSWGGPTLDEDLEVLEASYPKEAAGMWKAYMTSKHGVVDNQTSLAETIVAIRPLIEPILAAARSEGRPSGSWHPADGWSIQVPGPRM